MNGWDIVLILVITGAAALAIASILRRRKRGGCCGECSSCSRAGDGSCQSGGK